MKAVSFTQVCVLFLVFARGKVVLPPIDGSPHREIPGLHPNGGGHSAVRKQVHSHHHHLQEVCVRAVFELSVERNQEIILVLVLLRFESGWVVQQTLSRLTPPFCRGCKTTGTSANCTVNVWKKSGD